MKKEVDFYNFPIELLRGVFSGETPKDEFLMNILKFHIYGKYLEMPYAEFDETAQQRFSRCAKFWECPLPNEIVHSFFEDAETIYNSLAHSRVKTGISISIFWQFLKDYKTEMEWNCLLAILALKSLVMQRMYCKSTNNSFFARMNGFATINEYLENGRCELKEHRRRNLFIELQTNWNLKYYARHIDGFYFSFRISKEKLMKIAEDKKMENKKKRLQNQEKELLEKLRNQKI